MADSVPYTWSSVTVPNQRLGTSVAYGIPSGTRCSVNKAHLSIAMPSTEPSPMLSELVSISDDTERGDICLSTEQALDLTIREPARGLSLSVPHSYRKITRIGWEQRGYSSCAALLIHIEGRCTGNRNNLKYSGSDKIRRALANIDDRTGYGGWSRAQIGEGRFADQCESRPGPIFCLVCEIHEELCA
jgi:hypothetical protein